MSPYSQSDHDEAAGTGCLVLMVALVPLAVALLAAFVLEVVV